MEHFPNEVLGFISGVEGDKENRKKWGRNILPNQLSMDLCLNVKSTEKSKELISHNVSER